MQATIEETDLGDEAYDKVFAVHVAALHKPGPALDVVRRRLLPGESFHLFSQAPGWTASHRAEAHAEKLGATLEAAGFAPERRLVAEVGSGFAAGVVVTLPE